MDVRTPLPSISTAGSSPEGTLSRNHLVGHGGYCSPRQRMPSNSIHQGSNCVQMKCKAGIARRMAGCHSTQGYGDRRALDDVVGSFSVRPNHLGLSP
jgi:hypothetical protein